MNDTQTLSPAIAAQIAEIEATHLEHAARLVELTDEQKLVADYIHYKAIGEKYAALAKEKNDAIKEWTDLTGNSIRLGDMEAKVTESEKVTWDGDLAQVVLGDRCPLAVAVDTKKLDVMVKAGQLTQDEIKKLRTITTVKTLRIGKAK